MDPECQQRCLREVRERLALDTDPLQLRKALKTLSTLPIAAQVLTEIHFRKTVKHAKKHGLLLRFSRALAGKWPDLFPEVETSPEPGSKDSELSPWTKQQRNAAEDDDCGPARAPAPTPAPEGEQEDPSARSSSCSEGILSSWKKPLELDKPPGGIQNLPLQPKTSERRGERIERPSDGRLPLGGLKVGTTGSAKGPRTGPQGRGDHGQSATRKSPRKGKGEGPWDSGAPSWTRVEKSQGDFLGEKDKEMPVLPSGPHRGVQEERQLPSGGGQEKTRERQEAMRSFVPGQQATSLGPWPTAKPPAARNLTEPGGAAGRYAGSTAPRATGSETDSGRGKRRSRSPSLGPKSARQGPSQGQPGRSFEECLEDLSSLRGRSQRKRARKTAARPPGAGPKPGDTQLCRRGSAHCFAQPPCTARPESQEQQKPRFPVDDPALWSPLAEQEDPSAPVVRVISRTPVFSGTKRGRPPAESDPWRPSDAAQDPRDSLSQARPDLQPLLESQEQRLQALRTRIQCAQAEKQLQASQTKLICFNGGPGAEPGARQETSESPGFSAWAKRSPRPACAGLPPTGAPAPPSAHSKKPPAKKPAPLMAKALRDYKNRFSRR